MIPWQELIQSDGRLILAGGGQARSAHVDDDEEDDVTMVICICIYVERVPRQQVWCPNTSPPLVRGGTTSYTLVGGGPSRNLLQSWNQEKRKHSFTSVMPASLRTHVKILSFGCVTLQVTQTLIIQVVMSTCDKCLPNSQFQHHCNIVV